MENSLLSDYFDLEDERAKRRNRKKRKRMPVSGKSIFKILTIKKGK